MKKKSIDKIELLLAGGMIGIVIVLAVQKKYFPLAIVGVVSIITLYLFEEIKKHGLKGTMDNISKNISKMNAKPEEGKSKGEETTKEKPIDPIEYAFGKFDPPKTGGGIL